MHVLIADDEAPAREELRFILLELLPHAQFSEALDGSEALRKIETVLIDVVFLDINLPELSGLEVAAALLDMPNPPLVIFATGYDEYALQAFELAALDYVVKPFDETRLAKTVERLQKANQETAVQQKNALQAYVAQATFGGQLTKLWGERANGNRVLVDYQEIVFLEADAKQVYMQTSAGEKLRVRRTLKELEERIGQHNLVRVHKAFIVNLNHVAEFVPWFTGGYRLRMKDDKQTEIFMSRRYAAQLKHLLDW